jgi:anthranilate synthase component 1
MAARSALVREVGTTAESLRHLAATDPEHYPVLLDSVAAGPLARWSMLAARPTASLALAADGTLYRGAEPIGRNGFLGNLEAWWQRDRLKDLGLPRDVPFAGGWFAFLGYEVAAEIEPRLALPATPDPWGAFALRVPAVVLHDARANRAFIAAEPGAERSVEVIARDLADLRPRAAGARSDSLAISVTEEPPQLFLDRVARAQAAILAGDIYQANLSRGWTARLRAGVDALELYERLRQTNPAPFAAFAHWRGFTILSSSPERLLQIERGRISTRPIAGTKPRSANRDRDMAEAAALIAHPKERAEHIMLIDLERNDLGRVCAAGTVRVDEFMAIETYAHVHHIVSNVSGELRADVSPIGALRAVFPGGTITGCPKIRCMEIVAQEEAEGRGAYTGSLGYIGHNGDADFNILIRTLTLEGSNVRLRAGAGIVADSDPQRELEETRAKARGLLAALGEFR